MTLAACHTLSKARDHQLLAPPSLERWLGTDRLGRDVLERTILAASFSISRAFFVLSLAAGLGGLLAIASAANPRGLLDRLLGMTAEGIRAFPAIVIALLFVTVGVPGQAVLVFYFWVPVWRVLRGELISEAAQPYVLSSRLLGMSATQGLLREALPNAAVRVLPYFSSLLSEVLGSQCALEFLGFGARYEQPSLGGLLLEGLQLGLAAWWVWLPSLGALALVSWVLVVLARSFRRLRPAVPLE